MTENTLRLYDRIVLFALVAAYLHRIGALQLDGDEVIFYDDEILNWWKVHQHLKPE